MLTGNEFVPGRAFGGPFPGSCEDDINVWRSGGGGGGLRQPLGSELVLAVPPWDWRVNHGLFLWLLFVSKLWAALMNVACVNLEALLGNHGKMENPCVSLLELAAQELSEHTLRGSSQQLRKRCLLVPAWDFYRVSCSAKSSFFSCAKKWCSFV